jgi:hypothetical protein
MPALATARIALGFLLAPLAGIFVLSLFMCLSGPSALCHAATCMGDMFPFLTWLGLFCAYPPMVLIGVPLFFVLKSYNQVRPVPLALAGLVVGVAAAALFFFIEEKLSAELMVRWAPFAMRAGVGWAGPIAGLAFWGIAVFRNSALTRA